MIAGKVIGGRYLVEKHIGRGGMQDVYLAKDTILDVHVAIKTPQAGQEDKSFSKSARMSARVNHHNVAKTLDYLEENGSLFLVEEYVDGETLDKKIEKYKFIDPHMGARVFYHLAKGLAASHHAGVVHRDIKPSNIISENGVNIHRLKITDFGIATLTEEFFNEQVANGGDLTRSNSGTIKGALPYMAPEMMFRAPTDRPGAAVDVWSLGAMMFHLLTGKHPFGVYLQAAVNVQTKRREPWPDFMTKSAQYASLSKSLQNIVESCLEYSPESRPTSDELVSRLSDQCYICADRVEGVVKNSHQNGASYFANCNGQTVYFSKESIYGHGKVVANAGGRIACSMFPGFPQPRGHPIVIIG